MIIFRNLPMQWWLIAIGIYALRVGFSLNFGPALVGFYVDHVGWQWLYWQDALLAVLMAILVYLGAPREPVNKALLETADWGGMPLLGSGIAMIYAGLDQGNLAGLARSGTVVALLASGAMLIVAFFINEAMVKDPWAHANVLLSRNIGFALVVILLYTLTSLSIRRWCRVSCPRWRNWPEQTGRLLLVYCVLPMAITFPLSIWMARRFDVRILLLIGLLARGGGPAWNPDYPRMGAERLHPDGAAAIRRAVLHTSANHPDCAGQLRSDPGDRLRRLYPDHALAEPRSESRSWGPGCGSANRCIPT
jgi:DHA2 family multidrug resistance protein